MIADIVLALVFLMRGGLSTIHSIRLPPISIGKFCQHILFSPPSLLALKAKALHLADRTSEALEAAEAMAERYEERFWCAELHRLRGVFLAAMGGDETDIDASFCEAIRIAKEQKAISLAIRAEASCAEYRRQKACTSGGGFRLPLW